VDQALEHFQANFESDPTDLPYIRHLVTGVMSHRAEIDPVIEEHAEHWRLERMAVIDRNVLRLATFELAHCPDVPVPVILDEAIELAKKFGEQGSRAFVNGVMDRISKTVRMGV